MRMRPATRDDVIEMCGGTFVDNIWAMALEEDDELLAIAGVRYSNPRMCFSNIKPAVKESPRDIVRLARAVMQELDKSDVPVYALADLTEPTAPGFLEHLGFEHIMSSNIGEVYQWHQHC